MGLRNRNGLTLAEIIIALGILGFALLATMTIATMALGYQRQGLNAANAARVGDKLVERAVVGIVGDLPSGERDSFWSNSYPYPTSPYRTGTEQVGRDTFSYAIYALDVPGLGSSTASPPNLIRKIEAHVWWATEGEVGENPTVAWRMINSGSEP